MNQWTGSRNGSDRSASTIDIALVYSVPIAAAVGLAALGLVHSAGPRLAYVVSGLLVACAASFAALPILIVINVLSNRQRTPMRIFWLQSILAGAWVFFGSLTTWATEERFGHKLALWLALFAAIAVALTPIVPARQRSRRT